jgi:hypothetical protein
MSKINPISRVAYFKALPGKRKRDAQISELETRLEDPEDPYRAMDHLGEDEINLPTREEDAE